METLDLLHQLANCLAEKLAPAIPQEIALWDIKTCATYLRMSENSFRERFACQPDFPAAIRLPSNRGRNAHPLWRAAEVQDWALKYKEKRSS